VNERIRVDEVRLIDPEGNQLGIKPTREALSIALDYDLDLVEISPNSAPPVCRIMDYGKFKYEETQKAKKAKKHQSTIVIKEMKLRPKIEDHDFNTKKKHVRRFLSAAAKVKVTIMFRGREMTHTELGKALLERLADEVSDLGTVESLPKLDGRNMIMVIGPNPDVVAEVRRKKEEGAKDAKDEES